MQNALTLDVLMDMLLFEDLETANEKLAPYHLTARWIDASRGSVEIVSAFGGVVGRVGGETAQGDMFTAEPDTGAVIATAMEDSDDSVDAFEGLRQKTTTVHRATPIPTPPYQSPFRETPESDNEALRARLTDPESSLPMLLNFYGNGPHATSDGNSVPQVDDEVFVPSFADSTSDKPLGDLPDSLDGLLLRIREWNGVVNSTSDERTVNNTMRSSYRVLNDDEKKAVDDIKVMGTIFVDYLEELGSSRENSIAKTKMEEAVMWAVKGLTA